MKIFPQDLGTKHHLDIVYRRAYYAGSGGQAGVQIDTPRPKPRMGRLGRLWAKGSDLTPAQAAAVLPATGSLTSGMMYGLPFFWVFLGGVVTRALVVKGLIDGGTAAAALAASTAAITSLSTLSSRACFRSLHKKLSASEVNALPTGHDDLETAYLSLVIHAIEQPVPAEAETQIRDALRTLGEAIGRLPAVPLLEDNADGLRIQAEGLRGAAEQEEDTVIAASLTRQADALKKHADTIFRTAQYTRRAAAIRRELRAQIETLRAGLAAFDSGMGGIMDMNGLAEAVNLVNREADALTNAREELDSYALQPPATRPATILTETEASAEPLLTLRRNNG